MTVILLTASSGLKWARNANDEVLVRILDVKKESAGRSDVV